MSQQNLTITRGDSRIWSFTITEGGATYDITGCSFWFTGKYQFSDADIDAVFQKSSGSGIAITDAANGVGTITLDPSDTSSVDDKVVILEYDFRMKDVNSRIWTVNKGKFTVEPDVTLTTS